MDVSLRNVIRVHLTGQRILELMRDGEECTDIAFVCNVCVVREMIAIMSLYDKDPSVNV